MSDIDDGALEAPTGVAYKVPNAWRALRSIGEALGVLEANPDLLGEDVLLALESEAPDAVALLDACIYHYLDLAAMADAKETRLKVMEQRFKDAKARRDRARDLVGNLMQQLHLKKRDAPGGRANMVERQGKVHIIDEALVPVHYVHKETVITTKYDLQAIKKYLSDNPQDDIPGVARSNPYSSPTITGR